ncbi:hypothetical protein WMY93_010877 [Mugilogobius chulae]|uniref:Uncharacterized protein n=1 Tax=Mugilogobius chulae TaxID=88201 RepID=A0AAW0PLG6_9GOBI
MALREDVIRQFTLTEDGQDIVVFQINVGVESTPPVNDLCRFCAKNLRIKGVLSNSTLIFARSKLPQGKSLSDRLADLGMIIKPRKNRSTRMCKLCVKHVARLEKDLLIIRKWKDDEKKAETEETASTNLPEAESSDNKRARSPSSQSPPKPQPKKLRTELLPSQQKRKSVTQVITSYPCKTEVKFLQKVKQE